MKITRMKTKTKAMKEFGRAEWYLIHPEHFGHKQDKKYWERVKFIFRAKEDREILGMTDGFYMGGVMYISQLMVGNKSRGKGVGRALMEEAEKLASKNKIHKIFLHTGADWEAVKFYKKLGYKKEAKLPNHYEGKDSWVMSKFL